MDRNKFSTVPVLVVWVLAIVISGCYWHPYGAGYIPVSIPPDKGVVYIYRPGKLLGSVTHFSVFAEDKHICEMYNGTYFPYISKPGRTKFWCTLSPQTPLYIDVMSGEAYYIVATYTYGPPLFTTVSSEQAEKAMSKCNLIK